MTDRTAFPWARQKVEAFKALNAETFRQAPPGQEPVRNLVRVVTGFPWHALAGGAETVLNWLDWANAPAVAGQPDLVHTAGREDYRPGRVLRESDYLAPLGPGVMGGAALVQRGVRNTLGVFGGRVAAKNLAVRGRPTALEALDIAEALEARGLSDAAIRQATNEFIAKNDSRLGGVDRDAAGQWRFEINDRGARLTGENGPTLADALHHPELYVAMPDARTLRYRGEDPEIATAQYTSAQRVAGIKVSEGEIAVGRWFTRAERPRTVLHEVQHALQDLDQRQPGGNPNLASKFFPKMPRAEQRTIGDAYRLAGILKDQGRDYFPEEVGRRLKTPADVAEALGGVWADGRPITREAIELASDPKRLEAALDRADLRSGDGVEAYVRMAGETEARLVEVRSRLSAAERREIDPALMEDVPRTRQILIDERNRPIKQAQLTPGRPTLVPIGKGLDLGNGNVKRRFEIHQGEQNIGEVSLTWYAAEKRIHIWNIEVGPPGGAANALGPANLRHLHRQLRALYPAETMSGIRVSGAREKASADPDMTTKVHAQTGSPLALPPPAPSDSWGETKRDNPVPANLAPGATQQGRDVWIDQAGILNVEIRPMGTDPAPFAADHHLGRNLMRRVEVIAVDDTGPIQMVTVKGLADEEYKLPLRGQGFGMTSVPPVGSLGYLYAANGRPDQAFLMGLEHPEHRPRDRKEGETVLYALLGTLIEMTDDGDVLIKTPGTFHSNP